MITEAIKCACHQAAKNKPTSTTPTKDIFHLKSVHMLLFVLEKETESEGRRERERVRRRGREGGR